MEDRTTREYYRRAYRVFAVMQKKMEDDGVRASEVLRKIADILQVIEDHPELVSGVLEQLEKKWL